MHPLGGLRKATAISNARPGIKGALTVQKASGLAWAPPPLNAAHLLKLVRLQNAALKTRSQELRGHMLANCECAFDETGA
jgi:hypothetical protein